MVLFFSKRDTIKKKKKETEKEIESERSHGV
jgi:hypothetical protein